MSNKVLLGLTREKTRSGQRLPVVYGGEGNVLNIAQPGAGKSRSVAIPNLITYSSSAFVCDFKGELTIATALWRAVVLGQRVIVFDPFSVVPEKWLRSHHEKERAGLKKNPVTNLPEIGSYNPVDFVINAAAPATAADRIAKAVIPGGTHRDSHWANAAQGYFSKVLMFVAFDPRVTDNLSLERNMAGVWVLLSDPKLEKQMLKMMLTSTIEGVADQAAAFLDGSRKGEEMSSIRNQIRVACGASFNEPAIMATMLRTSLNFGEMSSRPITVYSVLPGDMATTHMIFPRQLISVALSEIERAGLREHGSSRGPTLFVMDEFATLSRFQLVTEAMGRMRGYGVKFLTFIQSKSQIVELYGEAGANVITGPGGDVVQCYGGTNDVASAEYISRICGTKTIPVAGKSYSGKPGDWGSTSYSLHSRAVYTPDEIMRLPRGEQIIKISGRNPMRECLLNPDLSDFPEYWGFMKSLEDGQSIEYAVKMGEMMRPAQGVNSASR